MAGYSVSPGRKAAEVLADIKRGEFAPVYILFGADSATADELLRALKEALVQPGMEAFDSETVDAVDLEVATLLQLVRQPPMASKRRLVIVRRVEQLAKGTRKSEDEQEADGQKSGKLKELLEGLARLPDACAVALTCDYEQRVQRAIVAAGLGRYVVDLRQPGEAGLSTLIHRRAKELGISLEPGAVRLLLDVSGGETTLLQGELEKLATAFDAGESITAADVRRLAGQSREFELNEYVSLVGRRDSAGALAVLRRLWDWDEPPMKVIAYLVNSFLGLFSNRYAAGEWDLKHVRLCLLQLYEINRDIVSGHPEPFALLEMFTVCAACPKTAEYCSVHAGADPPESCMRRRIRRHPGMRRKAVSAE